VQNVDKTLDPKNDMFGRNPDTIEQCIITHRDTPQRGRCYQVPLKSQWADEDKWIYPGWNFENLPWALCEEYDATLLHTAETLTALFM
jgi:hypothetical protein